MKKLIILSILLGITPFLQARTIETQADYTGSSRFDKIHANANVALTLNLQTGLDVTFANEHHNFKNPIYAVALPIKLDFDVFQWQIRPFYYFKNKSSIDGYQSASAFGVHTQLTLLLNDDTVNDLYTRAFIGAGFARQQGTVFFEHEPDSNQYYSQLAYTLGLQQDFFRTFNFRVSANVFQYPNGITGVTGLRSIMNQQELADTQTLDLVHDLGKYALNAQLTRSWADNGSYFYLGYRFGEYYTTDSEHSFLIGNSFPVAQQASLGFAYNHVRSTHNTNKRDIWQVNFNMAF